jgi:hypothetical protein
LNTAVDFCLNYGQPKISDQPLLLEFNYVVESNKPAVDFCINQLSTKNQLRINRSSLNAASKQCLNEMSG